MKFDLKVLFSTAALAAGVMVACSGAPEPQTDSVPKDSESKEAPTATDSSAQEPVQEAASAVPASYKDIQFPEFGRRFLPGMERLSEGFPRRDCPRDCGLHRF